MAQLLQNYSLEQIIIFVVMLACSIKATIDFYDWAKARLDKTYSKKQKETAVKKPEQPPKLKFTYKEQKEYEVIDEVIEKLENEIKQLEEDMTTFATDFTKLQTLSKEKEAKEEELMMQMERWEYLNELAERIEESKRN